MTWASLRVRIMVHGYGVLNEKKRPWFGTTACGIPFARTEAAIRASTSDRRRRPGYDTSDRVDCLACLAVIASDDPCR